MNVLVMAGTSDARKIITDLSMAGGISVLATATTPHGVELAKSSGAKQVLEGFFDDEKLANIIKENDIELLIDATHPFASTATKNAIKASDVEGVDYIRFERPSTLIPDSQLVYQVNSFEEAAVVVREILNINDSFKEENPLTGNVSPKGKVLHLAGVNTLHHLTRVISPDLIVARVLPMVYSVRKSLELGIPHVNILAMEGTFSRRFNGILMEEFQIKVVLTKESGESGGTMSKIQAALDLEVPVVIVTRPEIGELKGKVMFGEVELLIGEVLSRCLTQSESG
ncbi:MAG: precorrin-6A reductase [Methanobacterium sp.]|jgi:precorrin-6A/cobalt-precorrin-6A reductase|uniref:precorrin-6A reductase n=1 Tax=Methanobacterium sp. TaxID=2164 RepID=UPI00258900C5|nr:precorrin-6A reductase [Methanobacterium sp.]MCC7559102.1 precorrin-6A reductase [Methanobacterium sp.]